jgi:hypothetical protein
MQVEDDFDRCRTLDGETTDKVTTWLRARIIDVRHVASPKLVAVIRFGR